MGFEDRKIRPICVAVVRNGTKILACECFDKLKNEVFYRLLGGGIEFLETSQNALIREFEEELGAKTKIKSLIKVVENIFQFEDKKGHEICYVYEAEFVDKSLYKQENIPLIEKQFTGRFATWIEPSKDLRIYPFNPANM